MHVVPTHAASAISQIAGHAMAWFGDAPQLLDVQMQHVAGSQVFITLHRLSWFEIAQTTELEPTKNAAHCGPAQTCLLRNAQSGPALPAQSLNQLHLLGPGQSMQTVWSATSIHQPQAPELAITSNPFGGSLRAHVGSRSCGCQRPSTLDHLPGHLLSTPHYSSGILVIVHLVSCSPESSQTQLYRSRSDGQSIETSQLGSLGTEDTVTRRTLISLSGCHSGELRS